MGKSRVKYILCMIILVCIKYHSFMRYCFLSILFLLLLSCSTNTSLLYKIEEQGLFGYADSKGHIVINPIYSLVFTDTLRTIAFVAEKGDIIAINHKGESLFRVFNYDNGPDYVREGLFRIVDANELFGYADTLGNIVIVPQYKFAYPFQDGKAKVTNQGQRELDEEYWKWSSDSWFYIQHPEK